MDIAHGYVSVLRVPVNESGSWEVGKPETVPLARVNPALRLQTDLFCAIRTVGHVTRWSACGCFGRYREDMKRDSTRLYSM